MSITFRTQQESVEETRVETPVDTHVTGSVTHEEVPYTEFKNENGKPYLAKHFDLGDNWRVFNEEIGTVEQYVQRKIDSGEIANDVKAVQKLISGIEKINNLKDESRTVIRIGIVASYIKHLNEIEGIKTNWRKYGNTE